MATSQPTAEQQCPECDRRGREDGTDVVCPDCGVILDTDPVEHGEREWRAFDAAERASRARTGPPTDRSLATRGLGSSIGYRDGRTGDGLNHRQETINDHASSGSKVARNRSYATTEIQRIASALDFPDSLAEQAKHLFRQVHDAGDVQGNDLDTHAATCLYTVARVNQTGRTPDEVAAVARTDAKSIARRHTRLCDAFGVECPPPDPRQRVRVVASGLDFPDSVTDAALDRLDAADDAQVYRGSPSTVAAAVLYLASPDYVTQAEVADAAGCTPVSLRSRAEDVEVGDGG